MLRIGSLFSGYGGLDSAVQEVFGGSLAWVADPAPGPSKVLAYRHPDVPNLGDITAVDWSAVEPVDIITGGSPCQDLSTAGRRAGMTDGTRSNLWVQMREAIHAIRPRYVVWENVRGALSASAASAVESEPRLLGDGPRGPALRAIGDVWSETWPTAGTWADGSVYASPTWADAMDASASSCSPVLPTPTARDYKDSCIGVAHHRPEDRDTLSRALADLI